MFSPCDTEDSEAIPGTERKATRSDGGPGQHKASRRVLAFCKHMFNTSLSAVYSGDEGSLPCVALQIQEYVHRICLLSVSATVQHT